jgi:hypothetical protein
MAEGQDPRSNPAYFPSITAQGQPLEQRNGTVTQASEIFDDATMMPLYMAGLPFQQQNEQQ